MKSHSLFFFLLFLPLLLAAQPDTYTIEKAPFSKPGYDQIGPVYHGDGIVFSTNRKLGIFRYSSTGNAGLFSIYYADTTSDRRGRKSRLFSKELTSKLNDGPVSFNSTGDTIYFTRNRLVDGKVSELSSPYNRLGIFSAVLVNGQWTNTREFRYNSDWYNVTTPCLSPDGKRLYFASDKPFGYGGYDLYYSEWKNGSWENPVNMGPVINTEGNEVYPFISPAGEIFFSSDGHPGMGGKDIFYSRYVNKSWLEPVALDPPINSEYEDFGFTADALMSAGYFSSNRGASYDIYRFKTIFPQIFYTDFQRENQFCYVLNDIRTTDFDTTTLQFKWHFGDGESAYGEEVQHCYPGPGDYNVRLDVIQKGNGELFFTKLKYTLKVRKIEQAYIESPNLAAMTDEIVFTGVNSFLPGYQIIYYAWDLGDGTRLFGDTVKHVYTEAGSYSVNMVVTLKSEHTGIIRKAEVSKRMRILSNSMEKDRHHAEAAARGQGYTNIRMSGNTELVDQFPPEAMSLNNVIYRLELISYTERLGLNNVVFRNIPNKYTLKEHFNENDSVYSYTIEGQPDLMALYPAYNEMRILGFKTAQARFFELKDPAERELFTLLKQYDTSTDYFFDRNERLTTDAFIMLDQILRFMNRYPGNSLEIGVHTDNTGVASRNLTLSEQRAGIIAEYLINRGIERNRLVARGYGGTKPIAPNTSELDRRKNRRVEFRVL